VHERWQNSGRIRERPLPRPVRRRLPPRPQQRRSRPEPGRTDAARLTNARRGSTPAA
jgi:hypothetical protein